MRIPKTCRAAVLTAYGAPLEIVEVDVPQPDELEYGALLVRTLAATICGTDVHLAEGPLAGGAPHRELPAILGHEMSGEIVAIGPGAGVDALGQELKLGDRIVWSHGHCGRCKSCTVHHSGFLCESTRPYMMSPARQFPYLTGGFSEYVYVFPTAGRVKVPDAISDAVASAAACALRTVIHAFDRVNSTTRLDEDSTVVVLGTGPLGLFSVARAATLGAGKVIAIGGPANRLELAAAWGAEVSVDVARESSHEARKAKVLELTDGRGADVVLEMSGVPAAFNQGLDLLSRGGTYVVVGQLHGEDVSFKPSLIVAKHANVLGTLSASIDHYWRGLQFLEHYAERFDWDRMISGTYGLDDISIAMERMKTWEEIKPAITFATERR